MKLKLLIITLVLLLTSVFAFANQVVPANPYKNPMKAFNYVYDICVTQNSPDDWSAYMLGRYYEKGYGTKKNIMQAYIWYQMSVDQKYKPAISAIDHLKKQMSARQIRKAEKAYVKTRNDSIFEYMKELKHMT